MMKNLSLLLAVAAILLLSSCSLDDFFEQPSVTILSYELLEPPGSEVKLMMECRIKNNDSHDGDVKNINYTVTLEGCVSQPMTYTNDFTMNGGATIITNIPVTFDTSNALPLLLKIGGGSPLSYSVKGKIRTDTFLGMQDLTLNTGGSTSLAIDLNDFFQQPAITMDEDQGFDATSVNLMAQTATIQIHETLVTNMDSHAAEVIRVDYRVNIEGALSEWTTYTPPSTLTIEASGDVGDGVSIPNLEVTYSASSGIISAVGFSFNTWSYYVEYTITGKVLLEADLGSGPVEFFVPLNTSGSNTLVYAPSGNWF